LSGDIEGVDESGTTGAASPHDSVEATDQSAIGQGLEHPTTVATGLSGEVEPLELRTTGQTESIQGLEDGHFPIGEATG
jgi:hypothetical protein